MCIRDRVKAYDSAGAESAYKTSATRTVINHTPVSYTHLDVSKSQEVLEAIEEFEPRAEVENVTFELGDRPGTLIPIVEVKIIDGDE